MQPVVPEKLTTAATLQLVSGLVNVFVMAGVAWVGIGTVCGVCTIWGAGFGAVCAPVGCLLIPVGIFEAVAGIMGLTNQPNAGNVMRIASYVEMGSLLAGGLPSAVAGFLVYRWLNEPEVVAYLET